MKKGSPFSPQSEAGSALIIVLSFVMLLTVVVLAMLSHSLLNRTISNASSNLTKTELYGHGAIEQVLGDLRQEIMSGSTVASVTPAAGGPASIASPYQIPGTTNYIYRPSSPAASVPYNSGPYTTTVFNTTFPNLVKESTRNVAFEPYDLVVPMRATPINSNSNPSLNGRFVSTVRWNKALLLPKASASFSGGTGGMATTVSDIGTSTTPVNSFVAPDWILTAADGTNPTSWPSSAATTIANPKSTSYVVGRYAYVIYNEGGLLDANVAGGPWNTTVDGLSTTTTPTQPTLYSRKGPSAFADLTQLPGIADLATKEGNANRSQQIVDSLVGWRNAATAASTVNQTFPSYTFNSNSAGNYLNYLLGLSTNFMSIGSTSVYTDPHSGQPLTDQAFSGRQQMISFFQNVIATSAIEQAYLQDAMMYLGTFSRTLNQPSYWPDPNRPMVTLGSPTASTSTTATVGNNAYQKDNEYNPPFKSIVVASPGGWLRNDGTTALTGEPLAKKRFALSRLIWLTYKGPSATVPTSDPLFLQYQLLYTGSSSGTAPAWLTRLWNEGTAANIQNYFGLQWTSPSSSSTNALPSGSPNYWLYSGHASTNSSGGVTISKLDQVGAQNREPDFFELLQAAIGCGSLGTAVPQNTGGNYALYCSLWQQQKDSQVGLQVLQIGANMVNQVSPTNFPAHIVFNNGTYTYSIWGITDLPYLSDIGNAAIAVINANPQAPGSGADALNPNPSGVGVAFAVPTVWNPHASCSVPPIAAFYPAGLRVTASDINLEYPSANANLSALTVNLVVTDTTGSQPFSNYTNPEPWDYGSYDAATGTAVSPTAGNDNAIFFNYDPTLYREPTPLMRAGSNTPLNLSVPETISIDSNNTIMTIGYTSLPSPPPTWANGIPELGSGNNLVGFFLGAYPLRQTIGGTTYSVGSVYPNAVPSLPGIPYPGRTFSLEYQAQAGGVWIPYQQYDRFTNFAGLFAVPYNSTSGNTSGSGPLLTSWPNQVSQQNAGSQGQAMGVCDPRTNRWGISVNTSFQPFPAGDSTKTTTLTYRPSATMDPIGATDSDPLPIGATTQNLISNSRYFTDPDGVVRRAMGGYVSALSTIGLPMATVAGNSVNASNRPIILHRPFRSVAEMGYVFSDTPWKNIDFFSPESGDGALLDTFCINEDYRPDAVAAGRVDLNTKQAPVLQALLAGAYRDEELGLASPPSTARPNLSNTSSAPEAQAISQALVARTTSTATGMGPLENVADLVGRYTAGFSNDNGQPYAGFTGDLGADYTGGTTSVFSIVQRFRETTMRALSDAGQTGTWNLLIDVVVQSGHYPNSAASLSDFLVEGERRYWVHVAIDRSTGQVIDENIEVVNE